jgi:ubiquinone/menaquinone biosynthesis C-methylase UbiE
MKKDIESLLEIGWAYWRSQVLFAGVELGVFELLQEGDKESAKIAKKLGTDPRATEMLLNALVALKLLSKKKNRYRNTPLTSQYLLKGATAYQGDRIRHLHNLWKRWERLQESIRTGRSALEEKEAEPDPQKVRDFMTSMHNYARLKSKRLLKRLNAKTFHRLLDLGGGPGTYSIALARRNPKLKAVVYDLAPNLEIAREFIKEAGLQDRVTTQVGNFLEEDLGPEGAYDAILLSNVLHIYDPPTNVSILKKCHKALQPGGQVIVHDFLLDDSGTGPPFPAFFSLNMLLGTCSGACYRGAEIREWLSKAGFTGIKTRSLDKDSALIIGQKGV